VATEPKTHGRPIARIVESLERHGVAYVRAQSFLPEPEPVVWQPAASGVGDDG